MVETSWDHLDPSLSAMLGLPSRTEAGRLARQMRAILG
jgi:hypothetical protein